MWLLFVCVGTAADPSPALILPSAVPVARGDAEASLTVAHGTLNLLSEGQAVGFTLRAGIAPVDRMWVEVAGGGMVTVSTWCGLYAGDCSTSLSQPYVGTLAARYDLVELPTFRLAPMVFGAVAPGEAGGALF